VVGRQKRHGKLSPPKNKLIQDSEGNEENGYAVPDSNKTKIKYLKKPNEASRHSEQRNRESNH
jgi:hypothetical protein